MKESIEDYYKAAQPSCTDEIKKYEGLINKYSFLRLAWLLIGLVLFYQSFKFQIPLVTELTALFIVFAFGWLVKQQSIFEKKKNYFTDLKKVNANELNSINRMDTIYPDGTVWNDESHPYSSDLDIFGKGSLFKLLNRCSTAAGNNKLADWLKAPAQTSVILERQAAVKELSSKLSWKLHLQTTLVCQHTGRRSYE